MEEAIEEDLSVQFLESTRFWIQRVFVPIMVCIGVGGNAVTVVVLTRKRMRCSTNIYLTALAVADIIYLLFVFFLSFAVYHNIHDRKYELYWRFSGLTHWLCDSASSASVWLTVSFTLERYIAVCHPIKGKVLCTEKRAKMIITGIAIFCILTTLSTTFEYELAIDERCVRNCTEAELRARHRQQAGSKCRHNITLHRLSGDGGQETVIGGDTKTAEEILRTLRPALAKLLPANCSTHPHVVYVPVKEVPKILMDVQPTNSTEEDNCCKKKFTVKTVRTDLGQNPTYLTFISWFSALCFALIPLVLIATFNCFLVHAVYKSQRRRRKMTNSQETLSMSHENRITVMLIGVVFLFLVCQTPTATFLIYSNFYESEDAYTDNIHRALGNIFNFLVTVNAATNFIMYCILSKKYRTTFKALFCGGRKKTSNDTILMSSTRSRYSSVHHKDGEDGRFRRNASEYRTPRNLETQSLTSIPRSRSLMTRQPGKARSTDLNI